MDKLAVQPHKIDKSAQLVHLEQNLCIPHLTDNTVQKIGLAVEQFHTTEYGLLLHGIVDELAVMFLACSDYAQELLYEGCMHWVKIGLDV